MTTGSWLPVANCREVNLWTELEAVCPDIRTSWLELCEQIEGSCIPRTITQVHALDFPFEPRKFLCDDGSAILAHPDPCDRYVYPPLWHYWPSDRTFTHPYPMSRRFYESISSPLWQ